MLGFKWIVHDVLAGSPQPGLYGEWEEDIAYLKKRNINFVMSLTEEPLIKELVGKEGFGFYHLPIRDMDSPMARDAHLAINVLKEQIDAGNRVLIHCKGGVGRTGMIGACYLVSRGVPPEEAVQKVRTIHNAFIQTNNQERFVAHFEQFLAKLDE